MANGIAETTFAHMKVENELPAKGGHLQLVRTDAKKNIADTTISAGESSGNTIGASAILSMGVSATQRPATRRTKLRRPADSPWTDLQLKLFAGEMSRTHGGRSVTARQIQESYGLVRRDGWPTLDSDGRSNRRLLTSLLQMGLIAKADRIGVMAYAFTTARRPARPDLRVVDGIVP
jgi:hypothetical protein